MLDLDIGILTPSSLISKDKGRAILSLLCKFLPECIPEHYGNNEPLRYEFNLDNLEEALIFWQDPFLWKRKKPRAEGSVLIAGQSEYHSAIYINGQSKQVCSQRIVEFIHCLADLVEIDFAYIHLFSEQELEAATADDQIYEMVMPFRIGVTTHELRKYLPNLCWGTIFGSPYIELFGRERLLSSPAPIIQELSETMIYIQASENLLDLKLEFNEFDSMRDSIKKHLNNDAFLDPDCGIKHSYNAPQFYLT
jgi:hypothetical protein